MVLAEQIAGGFADPVFDAQAVFRALMDAMARPGSVRKIGRRAEPPQPLSTVAGAVALALCDHDTPLWLDPSLRGSAAAVAWLGFHCGAPLAHTPAEAHFALVADPAGLIALENFSQGTQEYPDRSTTLVLQVEDFSSGESLAARRPWHRATAKQSHPVRCRGILSRNGSRTVPASRAASISCSPRPTASVCLPRTTRIRPAEG